MCKKQNLSVIIRAKYRNTVWRETNHKMLNALSNLCQNSGPVSLSKCFIWMKVFVSSQVSASATAYSARLSHHLWAPLDVFLNSAVSAANSSDEKRCELIKVLTISSWVLKRYLLLRAIKLMSRSSSCSVHWVGLGLFTLPRVLLYCHYDCATYYESEKLLHLKTLYCSNKNYCKYFNTLIHTFELTTGHL